MKVDVGPLAAGWRWASVGELSERVSVGYVSSTRNFFCQPGEGVPLIRSQNIRPGRLVLDDTAWVTREFHQANPKSQLQSGDVLITRVGANAGDVCIVPEGAGEMHLSSAVFARPKLQHRKYMELFFRSPLGQYVLKSRIVGSVSERINTRDFETLSVLLPPAPEEAAIAHILGTLDNKIELNRRVNETLEATARALFKSWFVDFDPVRANAEPRDPGVPKLVADCFPSKLVFDKMLMREVPEGWYGINLGEALDLLKDGSHLPPKRVPSGVRFIAGATDVRHFAINFSKCTYITEDDYSAIHKKWHVQANDVLLTIVGTIGNVALVGEDDLPFSLQRSIAVLRPGPLLSSPFLYFWLNTRQFAEMLYSLVNPTGQPGVYLGALSRLPLCIPPRRLIDRFDSLASACISQMRSKLSESRNLAALRDALLPRFISGELRVKDTERYVVKVCA